MILNTLVIFIAMYVGELVVRAEDDTTRDLYKIEGKVYLADSYSSQDWLTKTRILVNGGEYLGFLREDGSFTVSNLPSGSYVIEVANPNFVYEPSRVDINSKGKFRARKVNYVQTSQVIQMPYPLKMKPLMPFRYFQIREQWRITDVLMNPMVLMMVLPMLLIMVLPKMLNDPETRKEMEQLNMPNYDMPEFSEMLTFLFGKGLKPKPKGTRINKKRQ